MDTVQTIGIYQVTGILGQGGMATVYEAVDPVIQRKVAIKTIRIPHVSNAEAIELFDRLKREAQAAGRLIHPNIVGIHEYGQTAEFGYIVMEYVSGPSLKEVLAARQPLNLSDILRIILDVLSALQHSHDRGVVHRDVKPANVLLTDHDIGKAHAKIADFGIARIDNSSMTQIGTIIGTPAYMSPEQFMGQTVDTRADIYSAGVLLYELLTNERPFDGSPSSVMHKALNTDPPAPSQIVVTLPDVFDRIVRKAMAKRPDERYRTAAAFADALRGANSVHTDEPTVIMPPAPKSAVPKAPIPTGQVRLVPPDPPRNRRVPWLLAAVPIVLALIGGGIYFSSPMLADGPPSGTPPRTPDPPTAGDFLGTNLKRVLARVDEPERSDRIREYLKATGARALALAPKARRSRIAAGDANDDDAETRALEQCQVWTNEPCALVARSGVVFPGDGSGNWPTRPMPRVAYAGSFDARQIPALTPGQRGSPELANYAVRSPPKAIALSPGGKFVVRIGTTQAESELLALRDCNREASRAGPDEACLIYATGDNVVLQQRRTGGSGIGWIAAGAKQISTSLENAVRGVYAPLKSHKAIAFINPTGLPFVAEQAASPELAERYALEGCQYQYTEPCVLLAVDDELRLTDDTARQPRNMDRLSWTGPFQADKLPWGLDANVQVSMYSELPGAKAIAVRPGGNRVVVVSGKASGAQAERDALRQCNENAEKDGPCFLYASGNRVVLANRQTQAMQ